MLIQYDEVSEIFAQFTFDEKVFFLVLWLIISNIMYMVGNIYGAK